MKALKNSLKWIFLIPVILLAGVLIYGTIRQNLYDRNVAKEFNPGGKTAELSLNKVHYKLIGNGNFTFVLEAGLGENIHTWEKIQDSLTQIGKVFMYDRSGLGYSESNSESRTTGQIAIELNELLKTENIPGPYVLVGHSIGGAHIRYYAFRFPKDVIGLFLIDASHEKMKDDISPPTLMERFFNFSAVNLSWSGIPYFMLPNPPHPTYKTSKSIRAYGREMDAIEESIEQFKSSNVDLSELPVYIISATAPDGDQKNRNLRLMEELIVHSNSDIKKHLIYDKPHHIHLTDPEIVIAGLREFTNKIFEESTVPDKRLQTAVD